MGAWSLVIGSSVTMLRSRAMFSCAGRDEKPDRAVARATSFPPKRPRSGAPLTIAAAVSSFDQRNTEASHGDQKRTVQGRDAARSSWEEGVRPVGGGTAGRRSAPRAGHAQRGGARRQEQLIRA